MAVTLVNLIKIAPFPEEQKKLLLEKIDLMTDQDKFDLTSAAWQGLAVQYFGKLKAEYQRLTDEAILNKNQFNPNDFTEAEARLIHEFAQKLESAQDQESIDEVRQQLEVYKTQPFSQDKTISSPPAHNPAPAGSVAGGPPPKS